MAKKYSVSPVLRPGTKTFIATFRNCFGERVTRSLETASIDRARVVCACLVELWRAGVKNLSDVPVQIVLQPEALRLYFGEAVAASDDVAVQAESVADLLPRAQREVEKFPFELREKLFAIIFEQLSLRLENIRLRDLAAALRRDLNLAVAAREAVERSILGRNAASAAKVPEIADSLSRFEAHIFAATSRQNAQQIMSIVRSFLASVPQRKTMLDVSAEDIGGWLDARVTAGSGGKAAGLRDSLRRRLGRFVKWCAAAHDYPSQMLKVPAVKKAAVRRDRGDIAWHELATVEKAIAGLPDDYWKALVAMLAYAGLQLAELVWLRSGDVDLAAGVVWIATVIDAEDETVRHPLKTAQRRRSVKLHAKYLLPRLKRFVKQKFVGKQYFFEMPVDMQRPELRSVSKGSAARWVVSTLTQKLLGQYRYGEHGRKSLAARPLVKHPGILPAGMTAKSLRRTFGSLLLRSGKTTAEVAAAMGNTENVVREHYARILGAEVDVDF